MPGMRRVVTGTDANGNAIIASDTTITRETVAMMPGAGFASLWGNDAASVVPNDGSQPAYRDWFPPATGYRVEEIVIPPDAPPPTGLDMAAAESEMNAKVRGLLGHMDPHHPGMHQTATVDFNYILAGRCIVSLDNGATIDLAAGDCLVNNGTRHAWHVPFAEPCRLICFSVGAAAAP